MRGLRERGEKSGERSGRDFKRGVERLYHRPMGHKRPEQDRRKKTLAALSYIACI